MLNGQFSAPEPNQKQLAIFPGKLRKDPIKRAESGQCQSRAMLTISDSIAAQIASYLKLAVQRNIGNISAIIQAINAIHLHLSGNDHKADSHHRLCHQGPNSLCRYQAAISNGTPIPRHPNYLTTEAAQLVAIVFSDFGYNSSPFIEKILDGHTSNHNESLHSVLWSMVQKNEYARYEMINLGSALAAIRYNDGFQ